MSRIPQLHQYLIQILFTTNLWKEDPLNPNPFSCVQSALKFSAVLGTTSARSQNRRGTNSSPSVKNQKYTLKRCRRVVIFQAFFGQVSANLTQLEFGILARVFFKILLELSFFHDFQGIFQISAGIFKSLKIFNDKNAVFRSTFKFPP